MDWYEHYEALLRSTHAMDDHMRGPADWKAVLRWSAKANEHLSEVILHACQQAYNEGVTKKEIATIFGFPPSVLRGMKKTA